MAETMTLLELSRIERLLERAESCNPAHGVVVPTRELRVLVEVAKRSFETPMLLASDPQRDIAPDGQERLIG